MNNLYSIVYIVESEIFLFRKVTFLDFLKPKID